MTNKESYDYFLNDLFENAVSSFQNTPQSIILNDKIKQMNHECDAKLKTEDKIFVADCFELFMEAGGQEEQYVYQKAYHDCVTVLKWMGVLA